MLILIAFLTALIPAVAILYPFLRRGAAILPEDESSVHAELSRRWEAALAELKSTELERAIGSLDEESYRWLRRQQMTEAALVLKGMDLEQSEEEGLLSSLDRQVGEARARAMGHADVRPAASCPSCSAEVSGDAPADSRCRSCGQPLSPADPDPGPGEGPPREATGE